MNPSGRSIVLLIWLWVRSENTLPIPGFKTIKQIEENAAAVSFGPLTQEQMNQIEMTLER
jgi:aryl-alcohol dehydrogenase-like predicted oxidoreductase